jgi:ketosteroid isomerase-like protein
MRALTCLLIGLASAAAIHAQSYAQQIYDTERAFERAVAERGIRDGFIEFLSPLGIIYRPGPVNGRESWRGRPASPASLTWNPVRIETSSNGALAYSLGNSIFRARGKDDPELSYGHYLSVWTRQPGGEYRAALEAGISHGNPAAMEPDWNPPAADAATANPKNLFAGDSSIGFFRMSEDRSMAKAYKAFASDDIYLLREGKLPFVGRSTAVGFIEDQKLSIRFPKRRSFIEAGDLAYVNSEYTLLGKDGSAIEKGNFVQVWKLRNGRWQIAADLFLPLPPAEG